MFERLACLLSEWFASPLAVIGMPIFCAAWLALGFSENALTLALSILAITMTQSVLVAGKRSERAILAALEELVRAVPEAREDVLED